MKLVAVLLAVVFVLFKLPPKARMRSCNLAAPKLSFGAGRGATVVHWPVLLLHNSEAVWASVPPPPITTTDPSLVNTACNQLVVDKPTNCFLQ